MFYKIKEEECRLIMGVLFLSINNLKYMIKEDKDNEENLLDITTALYDVIGSLFELKKEKEITSE
mgnify:FL=1